MKNIDCTLYFITNSEGMDEETFLSKVKGACEGGVTLVQLREKNRSTLEYYQLACKVKQITDTYGITLIIDDRIDVPWLLDAEFILEQKICRLLLHVPLWEMTVLSEQLPKL